MMITTIYPYLILNGNGQEAIKFYEQALDATVVAVKTFGDMHHNSDAPLPEIAKNRVLNAQLKVGNTDLMISDTFPGTENEHHIGTHISIALIVDNVEKSKEVFAKLSEGGEEIMPLQETFWSPSYGQITDKFGVNWQITTEVIE